VTQDGEPCDDGSHLLTKDNKVPAIKDATLGRTRVIKQESRYLIALVTKTRASTLLEILKEALRSLYDVTLELNLRTISISKIDMDYVSWANVRKFLRELFYDSPTKIIVRDNRVIISEPSERNKIITENHVTAIGGHKGITKTYKRIRHNFWSGMKAEIQKYIRECRNCQLKKLVRVKTRQPMVLTDTPDTAFDKVSMDIVEPLPTTESGHSYILTIQDLLTKYFIAVPYLRQHQPRRS
jgi:hypothetical protein